MKVLKDNEEVVITGKELAKHRDICRKEGAIGEIALMKLCIQNEGSWKGIQEHIEKRLKELEKKVLKNEFCD